jgi:hypothetical protein
MGETQKIDGEKSLGLAPHALPGRKLATSKAPRMLKPFETDLLREDLRAVLARLPAARSRQCPAKRSHALRAAWVD